MDIIVASMSHPRTQTRFRGTRRLPGSWTGRRLSAALACLAFLLQALVPSFAWAVAARHGAAGSPPDPLIGTICSAHAFDGDAAADPARTDDPVTPEPLPAAAHCPLCLLPTGSDSAPLVPFFPALATPAAPDQPAVDTATEVPPTIWRRSPSARAPPAT